MLLELILLAAAAFAIYRRLLIPKLFKEGSDVGWTKRRYANPKGIAYFLFCLKYPLAYAMIWLQSRRERKRRGGDPEPWESLLPDAAYSQSELPQDLTALGPDVRRPIHPLSSTFLPLEANDAVAIQGSDAAGNQVQVRMGRRLDGRTEFWLLLRLVEEEGAAVWVHPLHPVGVMEGGEDGAWSCGGLKVQLEEPSRRWRLTYRGWLRKWDSREQADHKFVKMAFHWTALSDVFNFNTDLSPRLTARALAQEHWCPAFFAALRGRHREERYEQWGQLVGSVSVEGEAAPRRLRLRGMRDHCFGARDWRKYERYTANWGYTEDGTFFHVGAVSMPASTTQLLYGYVGWDDGRMVAVDESSLSLPLLGEDGNPPINFTVSFSAGPEKYRATIWVESDVDVFNGASAESHSFLRFVRFRLVDEATGRTQDGTGFSEFEYRNRDEKPAKHQPHLNMSPSIGLADMPQEDASPLILPLSHRSNLCEELVGGKARQLHQLSVIQKNFTVPTGCTVTTAAFNKFLDENPELRHKMNLLTSPKTASAVCDEIHSEIAAAEFPAWLSTAASAELRRLFGHSWEDTKLAVRSSAVGEDGAEASSAGQMDTLLSVSGSAGVFRAVLRCWASGFASSAVAYRRSRGLPPFLPVAVVVQQMAPVQLSGVLFTCHPLSGHVGQMVINAHTGLGEDIVSGLVTPDGIVVERSPVDGSLSVGEKTLEGDSCCMTDEEILRLSDIGRNLEGIFGSSRDVEWGMGEVAEGRREVFLLQARPVTALAAFDDWDWVHEFDTPVFSRFDYSTRHNVGEVMGGVLSPLGLSIASRVIDKAIQQQMVDNGSSDHLHPDIDWIYTNFGGRIMMKLSQTIYRDPNAASNRNVSELCILGRTIDNPILDEVLEARFRSVSRIHKAHLITKAVRMMMTASGKLASVAAEVEGLEWTTSGDSRTLLRTIEDLFPLLFRVWEAHVGNSGKSSGYYHALIGVLVKKGQTISTESYADVARMLGSCAGVESADVPAALKVSSHNALAQTIIESGGTDAFMAMNETDGLHFLESEANFDVRNSWSSFLRRHGHRSIDEIDLLPLCWWEAPGSLVPVLQGVVGAAGRDSAAVEEKPSLAEVIADLKTPLSAWDKRVLAWILPRAQAGVADRERCKSLAIRVNSTLRIGYRRLGTALWMEAAIPDPELVFFLTHSELRRLVAQPNFAHTTLIARAVKRRGVVPAKERIRLPELVLGYPSLDTEAAPALDPSLAFLSGTPVSNGRVEGRARVCRSFADASRIEAGEVLVAHSTDIAWSVYFPLLGGVVTELGGLLSHGAVVAREFGLPCVVSVPNATDFLKDGDMCVLDGTAGRLIKVSKD